MAASSTCCCICGAAERAPSPSARHSPQPSRPGSPPCAIGSSRQQHAPSGNWRSHVRQSCRLDGRHGACRGRRSAAVHPAVQECAGHPPPPPPAASGPPAAPGWTCPGQPGAARPPAPPGPCAACSAGCCLRAQANHLASVQLTAGSVACSCMALAARRRTGGMGRGWCDLHPCILQRPHPTQAVLVQRKHRLCGMLTSGQAPGHRRQDHATGRGQPGAALLAQVAARAAHCRQPADARGRAVQAAEAHQGGWRQVRPRGAAIPAAAGSLRDQQHAWLQRLLWPGRLQRRRRKCCRLLLLRRWLLLLSPPP